MVAGRWAALVGLAVWLCAAPVHAETAAVEFQVIPGGVTLEDMDQQGQAVVTAAAGPSGTLRFSADTSGVHTYRIQRNYFNDLDFTLWWGANGQWQYRGANGERSLRPSTVFLLSRTVRLNVEPLGWQAYIAAPVGNAEGSAPSAGVLDVAGALRQVIPLLQDGDRVVVPDGYNPPVVFLAHPRFETHIVQIPSGVLDSDIQSYPPEPVKLHPLYGPFSYPAFDIGSGVVLVVLGLAWWFVLRPRQLAARRRLVYAEELLTDILDNRKTLGNRTLKVEGEVPVMTEQTVCTESGARFVLLRILGEGAMGAVYEAKALEGDKEKVAIKIILYGKDDEMARSRFTREARIYRTLQHPAIVKVLDWGMWQQSESRAVPFMVMELLRGRTLRQVLHDYQGPLPQVEVIRWLVEALHGLRVAHQAGIIHRDLKPENLMLTDAGHIKIMDFGVAHWNDETMTKTNAHVGTPLYMSPEHFDARQVTAASDIYSLGMVAYEMLAGRSPFDDGDVWTILARVLREDVPPVSSFNPDVSPQFEGILTRMIARDPGQRYADATSLLQALLGQEGTAVEPEPDEDLLVVVEPDESDPRVGNCVGSYVLVRKLGAGGAATVYSAVPMGGKRSQMVALKLFHHIGELGKLRERFVREAEIGRSLQHPNLARVVDCHLGVEDAYIVMELVEGQSLMPLIPESGMPLVTAMGYLRGIFAALDYAHAAGVVHCDLKPTNVMVTPAGEVKLMDFGIANGRWFARLTATTDVLGTPGYLAPEQLDGIRNDPRTDQYALGVMIYEMLTGERLFSDADVRRVLSMSVFEMPPLLHTLRPALPPSVSSVVDKMIAKSVDARYDTIASAWAALVDASAGAGRATVHRTNSSQGTIQV